MQCNKNLLQFNRFLLKFDCLIDWISRICLRNLQKAETVVQFHICLDKHSIFCAAEPHTPNILRSTYKIFPYNLELHNPRCFYFFRTVALEMANEEEEELLGVIKDVKGFLKRFVQYLNSPLIFLLLFWSANFQKIHVLFFVRSCPVMFQSWNLLKSKMISDL